MILRSAASAITQRVAISNTICDDLGMDALNTAIDRSGGVSQLAAKLGVRQNVVSNWRGRGKVAADRVLDVEAATGVSRHDLRPDIFGPAPAQLPNSTPPARVPNGEHPVRDANDRDHVLRAGRSK